MRRRVDGLGGCCGSDSCGSESLIVRMLMTGKKENEEVWKLFVACSSRGPSYDRQG
jgi:hypothetical protein